MGTQNNKTQADDKRSRFNCDASNDDDDDDDDCNADEVENVNSTIARGRCRE